MLTLEKQLGDRRIETNTPAVIHNRRGAQVHVIKTMQKLLWFELALWRNKQWNMTSLPIHHMKVQIQYNILNNIKPLLKRIGEPPQIQIGCCKGDTGKQRHSGSSYDLFWLHKTVRRLRH